MKILLTILLLIPSLCFGWGAVSEQSVGGGGTLLVGDNTTSVTDQTSASVDANGLFGRSYTASASGTSAKAYARIRAAYDPIDVKFVIAASDGTILAVSSAVSVDTTYSDVEFTISETISSTDYKIGVIANGSFYPASSGTWSSINDSNSYTSPTSFDGSNGDAGIGLPLIWVTD